MSETSKANSFRVPGHHLIRVLGTGAQSVIWLARDDKTGRQYSVKRVVRETAEDDRFFEQVRNEYAIASQINHPNVREVYRLHKVRSLLRVKELLLVMEFCPGKTLQEQRPTGLAEACGIFVQVANALHRVNEAGFVHADIKPNNVVVDAKGNVKLIDFGQSCPIGTVKPRIQGTPEYMAPEQVHRWPVDERTDVYNFGATCYWALTGRTIPSLLPQAGELQFANRPPLVPPQEYNEQVPDLLSRLILDCTRLQVEDRPASMQDVLKRLGVLMKKAF